ncbi:MAG: glycoside hydrolase family 4 [Haloarculaceae archaeon]
MYSLDADRPTDPETATVAVVGGGSRNWGRVLANDLARTGDLAGTVRLYDVDPESARRNVELGERFLDHPDAVGDWTYEAVDSLAAALSGADFVVCSTQDPPGETFVHDLEIPAEYGIQQTVGDTVGPGGAFRALRAIPQYREVAAAVREHCPDAWVLNYTNPMTVCTRTLSEEYPEINAIGLCHEVYHTQGWLADLVERHLGVERPDSDAIDLDVTGVNHFTWVDRARWNGHDLLELVDAELAERDPGERFAAGDNRVADASVFVDNNEVTLDLYDRFGVLPAAGDRHLVEFVPWYLAVDERPAINRWGIRFTPAEYRADHWDRGRREREALLSGEQAVELEESGEKLVDIMRALAGLGPLKTNVNTVNRGQAPDLPKGAVVETNALVTGDTVTPLTASPLPETVRTHVDRHVSNQETLVEAGFAGDLDLAFEAFCNDPLVTLDPHDARDLFADLVAAERPYLTDYDLDGASVLDGRDV